MKIRGLLKNTAIVAGALAIPSLAAADTVEDVTNNVSSPSNVAQVVINVAATVGGTLRLWVNPRNANTVLIAPTVASANPTAGSIEFGIVDANGNQQASTGPNAGSESSTTNTNPTNATYYVAELNARVFYTGLASVGLEITGATPTSLLGTGTPPAAEWACGSEAGVALWATAGYGNTLAASTDAVACNDFNGGVAVTQVIPVDLAFLVSSGTGTGTWDTDFTFTATPVVL